MCFDLAGGVRSSLKTEIPMRAEDIAKLIDHTLLKPEATAGQIRALCEEAAHFGFASVCINPCYVPLAADLVRGSTVKVCTVVGFPLGATLAPVKVFETEQALKNGAEEIDMVINVGALKSSDNEAVEADICGVVDASHRGDAICKVILEMALLTGEEKIRACRAAMNCDADYVKTSTGFGPGGATVEDVALMRSIVGPEMGIKAAGGIRTLAALEAMLAAGATRIGSSSGVKIIEDARRAGAK